MNLLKTSERKIENYFLITIMHTKMKARDTKMKNIDFV